MNKRSYSLQAVSSRVTLVRRRRGRDGGVTGVIADTPHCAQTDPCPVSRPLYPERTRSPGRLPTPLSRAYVCKSDLYLNIIDFRPHIRYHELVSHCVRLISMAFLSTEHDKCIWEIKFCGWVCADRGRPTARALLLRDSKNDLRSVRWFIALRRGTSIRDLYYL